MGSCENFQLLKAKEPVLSLASEVHEASCPSKKGWTQAQQTLPFPFCESQGLIREKPGSKRPRRGPTQSETPTQSEVGMRAFRHSDYTGLTCQGSDPRGGAARGEGRPEGRGDPRGGRHGGGLQLLPGPWWEWWSGNPEQVAQRRWPSG